MVEIVVVDGRAPSLKEHLDDFQVTGVYCQVNAAGNVGSMIAQGTRSLYQCLLLRLAISPYTGPDTVGQWCPVLVDCPDFSSLVMSRYEGWILLQASTHTHSLAQH